MNGKKLFSLLLALLLIISAVPALAAPTRDVQAMEATVDEKLQTLVNIACEAIPEECFGMGSACIVLEQEQAPNVSLTQQALWAAVLLTCETTWISDEEADHLYRQIFTNGAYDAAAIAKSELLFTAAKDGGLEIKPDVREIGCSGAHVYDVTFDGTDALVQCDLYLCEVEWADVNEVSDVLLTWTNPAELSLRFAPETEFGWTLNSIALSPSYRDGNFGDWWEAENRELEYSVNVPGSLELRDETTDHWTFKNIEGDVTLTIEAKEENLTYDQALAAFMKAHPGREIVQERLYDAFTSTAEGEFIMVVTADEYPWTYTITLTFPKDRQAEYEFYAEIIRNSFGVWRLSNG